jgi:hypothetical protein
MDAAEVDADTLLGTAIAKAFEAYDAGQKAGGR